MGGGRSASPFPPIYGVRSFYENMDPVRQTIVHVIPWYDDDGDNVTFTVVTQSVANADGQQALTLFSNGQLRMLAPLDYERGVQAFHMVIDMTDTGSLGRLPPLTTRFRLDLVLMGACVLPPALQGVRCGQRATAMGCTGHEASPACGGRGRAWRAGSCVIAG